MSFLDRVLGRSLGSNAEQTEPVGVLDDLSVFDPDAPDSVAYSPEAALTLLIPADIAGLHDIVPLSATTLCPLLLVYFSYRQTIGASPNGGGSSHWYQQVFHNYRAALLKTKLIFGGKRRAVILSKFHGN